MESKDATYQSTEKKLDMRASGSRTLCEWLWSTVVIGNVSGLFSSLSSVPKCRWARECKCLFFPTKLAWERRILSSFLWWAISTKLLGTAACSAVQATACFHKRMRNQKWKSYNIIRNTISLGSMDFSGSIFVDGKSQTSGGSFFYATGYLNSMSITLFGQFQSHVSNPNANVRVYLHSTHSCYSHKSWFYQCFWSSSLLS